MQIHATTTTFRSKSLKSTGLGGDFDQKQKVGVKLPNPWDKIPLSWKKIYLTNKKA